MSEQYLLIYNETSLSFLKKCQSKARLILKNEMGLEFKRSRIFYRQHFWPIHFVVFEHPTQLGFFQATGYRIGLNKSLMYKACEQQIDDILRHELGHYMTHLKYGANVDAHGPEFREVCQSYGWSKRVYHSTTQLNEQNLNQNHTEKESFNEDEKVIQKVKKILALTQSSNEHESKLATAKANEILKNYNLSSISLYSQQEDSTYLLQVARAKRNNSKLHAIYEILSLFFVRPVFNYGKGEVYLEVIGKKVNVELADYVASFLDNELEQLWKIAQKESSNLKGLKAKNSFFQGLAHGYCTKIKENLYQQNQTSQHSQELIKVENDLQRRVKLVYGRLSSTKTKTKDDKVARKAGEQRGKNLNIRPGINGKQDNNVKKILPWF